MTQGGEPLALGGSGQPLVLGGGRVLWRRVQLERILTAVLCEPCSLATHSASGVNTVLTQVDASCVELGNHPRPAEVRHD